MAPASCHHGRQGTVTEASRQARAQKAAPLMPRKEIPRKAMTCSPMADKLKRPQLRHTGGQQSPR